VKRDYSKGRVSKESGKNNTRDCHHKYSISMVKRERGVPGSDRGSDEGAPMSDGKVG
jgi:hypothetical protein